MAVSTKGLGLTKQEGGGNYHLYIFRIIITYIYEILHSQIDKKLNTQ